MKTKQLTKGKWTVWLTMILLVTMIGCRKEPGVLPPEQTRVMDPAAYGKGSDFYLLNEGNMGSNKASLDFFNHLTGEYALNMYANVNPGATLGLGDVGNDIQIYGNKLYVVVNGSNKVEVLDKKTAVKLGQINIDNCRSIVFRKSKAYISSYKGYVAVVDTSAVLNGNGMATAEKKIEVGREPEGMTIIGDTLYVANSGGYSPPLFDRTISVIDLEQNKQVRKIDVGINLSQVDRDQYGHLWVSSRGNYQDIEPSLYVLDSHSGEVIKHWQIPVGNFTIKDDLLYYFSSTHGISGPNEDVTYGLIDLSSLNKSSASFISDAAQKQIKLPFALAIDPVSGRVLITDAGDIISPGTLNWLDTDGNIQWSTKTGDVPGHIVFL